MTNSVTPFRDGALRRASVFALWLLGTGCGSTASVIDPPALPVSVVRQVTPSLTDAAIDTDNEPHVAVNPSSAVSARGKLLVFLPGTGAVPTMYQLLLTTGAARGYHAIGLNYPNPNAVGVLCGDDTDPDCFWDVRREVLSGVNTSGRIQVTVANSIVNRLEKLLGYLQTQHPTEGWGQFLVNGAVDWSRVTLAGHSQGGGHVGVMAKLVSLDRAVYFSSPADWRTVANAPATWTSKANVTDASRQFGFSHVQDGLVPYLRLQSIWPAMGLGTFGAAISIDNRLAPFSNAHMLTTSATPLLNGTEHGSTVADAATPRSSTGTPLFEAVWIYLCFP